MIKTILTYSVLVTSFAVVSVSISTGIVLAQSHAGQMDTDGILSPGERRNPKIDYDSAQRHAERHGDDRVDNQYNDDAAADARDDKRYANDRDYRDSYDRREEERHHRRDRSDY